MIWLWLLLPVVPVALAVFLGCKFHLGGAGRSYSEPSRDGLMVANIAAAFVLFFVALVPTIRQIEHNQSAQACRGLSANFGRETRFFTNSYFDYDCYVRTDLGDWVVRDNVTETELRGGR